MSICSVYWYFTDHLGTVRDVATYSAGTTTIANHIAFDTFGKRVSETNSGLADYDVGFTGKWLDRATGLQWNHHRWYNAAIGRWMSQDPIGFGGRDPNPSRYVGNMPTMYVDSNGLDAQPAGSGGIGSSGWNPWNLPGIRHLFVDPWTWGIQNRTVDIEHNIRRRQQEFALAHPECADSTALIPYASDVEIQVMTQRAEGGLQLEVGLGSAQLGAGASGIPLRGSRLARAGRAAEGSVSKWTGIPINRGRGMHIVPGTGKGGYRIPDLSVFGEGGSIAVRGSVIEVKDTTRLYCSKQIEDLARFAEQNNIIVELFTNGRIPESGKLYDFIYRDKRIIVHPIPAK